MLMIVVFVVMAATAGLVASRTFNSLPVTAVTALVFGAIGGYVANGLELGDWSLKMLAASTLSAGIMSVLFALIFARYKARSACRTASDT